MPYTCIFPGCPKKVGDLGHGRRKVSFFRLPRADASELKKWCDILSLDMNNLSAANTERVCSEHFNPDDILVHNNKNSLVIGAVPIWFSKSDKIQQLSLSNNCSSILRNLRLQSSELPDYVIESIPFSYMDIKPKSSSPLLINIHNILLKKIF
ncbi:unnamed protein product [Rotaria sp. Silwood1]|nr:unnamed protein product [Rotaria sp. Silwood1]